MKDFLEPANLSSNAAVTPAQTDEHRQRAIGLARLLAFALAEAKELQAHECEAMLHYGLGDLQMTFGFGPEDFAPRVSH